MNVKLRIVLVMAVCILLLSMNSLSFAVPFTGNTIANKIENMEKKYLQKDWNGTGSIKSQDLSKTITEYGSIFFENNSEIFDDVTVFYVKDKSKRDKAMRIIHDNQELIELDGRTVLVGMIRNPEDSDYIYYAKWITGPFYINLLSTGFKIQDETGNVRELKIMMKMINNALADITIGEEVEEEEEVPEDATARLIVENNPITDQEYKGVLSDSSNQLKMNLILGDNFTGTINIAPLLYGELESQKTGTNINASGDIELVYIPKDYPKSEENMVVENIKITYTTEEGVSGSLTKQLEIVKQPVMLIHGFTGDATTWLKLGDFLDPKGYDTTRKTYYYEDASGQSIPAQGRALGLHIKEKLASFAPKDIKATRVDLVAHSMGGLISRYLITRLDAYYNDSVRKLIMVGTPNHGCGELDKVIGWSSAYFFEKHRTAADQLYSKSPFIVDLNRDEKNGKHLDPNVEYGLIYGSGTLLGDGVVTDTSAMLNGVTNVQFPGLTHSPAVATLGPPLTEDEGVFNQVYSWLNSEIPKGTFTTVDMRIYSYEGEAYKQNIDYDGGNGFWALIEDVDDLTVSEYESIKTGKGKVTIVLKAGLNVFGTVDVYENSELYFEYASPHMLRVGLDKGSAKFTTNPNSDKHFETSIRGSDNVQVIRGIQTSYVVTSGATNEVYCLEGSLEVINSTGFDNTSIATLRSGQGASLQNDGSFEQVSIPPDKWWEEEFYNKNDLEFYFNEYRLYVYIAGGVILFLILVMIVRRKKRKKRKRA